MSTVNRISEDGIAQVLYLYCNFCSRFNTNRNKARLEQLVLVEHDAESLFDDRIDSTNEDPITSRVVGDRDPREHLQILFS